MICEREKAFVQKIKKLYLFKVFYYVRGKTVFVIYLEIITSLSVFELLV